MITIIDYGSGNIYAIANIYKRLNIPFEITNDLQHLKNAKKLILPGVGDFDETMILLKESGIKDVLDEVVLIKKIPILGVCVGMQILGKSSDEGTEKGFGWIDGVVKKIDIQHLTEKPHLPHMGWNDITPTQPHLLFTNVDIKSGYYFLHSYYFSCNNESDILAKTKYGCSFASAVFHDNIYGVQFHPEKSHENGIKLFKNYAELSC